MEKTALVKAEIDSQLKEEAEEILHSLGISVDTAIELYYRQIIEDQGIPFDMIFKNSPLDPTNMSDEELEAKLQRSLEDCLAGRVYTMEEVDKRLKALEKECFKSSKESF